MMTSMKYIYILQREYIKDSCILHDRKPVCGSEDLKIIIARAKAERDYILYNNDPWFDYVDMKQESLVAWNGFNYFAVGTSDKRLRIAFTISFIPLLSNDISE